MEITIHTKHKVLLTKDDMAKAIIEYIRTQHPEFDKEYIFESNWATLQLPIVYIRKKGEEK